MTKAATNETSKDTASNSTRSDSAGSRAAGQEPPYAVPRMAPPSSLVMLQRQIQGTEEVAPIQREKALGQASAPPGVPNTSAGGGGDDPPAIRTAAAEGIKGASSRLPYFDTIQQFFGHHDVSHIQAHLDNRASNGARAMGARAFATKNHVAFDGTPDLHTVAHEAAHVVQQRGGVQLAGGVGEVGDPYEQHADAVANLVVNRQSAESLLDVYASRSGGTNASFGAVQRKLRPNMNVGDAVVKHMKDGDEDGYKITRVYYFNEVVRYDIARSNPSFEIKGVTISNRDWGPQDDQVNSHKEWEAFEKKKLENFDENAEALKLGENFLSGDYKRINTLLGAIRAVHGAVDVRSPDFNLNEKKDELLKEWRKTALSWKVADQKAVEAWDIKFMIETFELYSKINSVWSKFPKRELPTKAVYRGDSFYIYESYPYLNPDNHKGSEVELDKNIIWPTVMSTSYDRNNVLNHSYIKGKDVLWIMSAPANHEGKKIGDNNPSETEATFPAGTKIHISRLILRKDKKAPSPSPYDDITPNSVEVIVLAEILSEEAPIEETKVKNGKNVGDENNFEKIDDDSIANDKKGVESDDVNKKKIKKRSIPKKLQRFQTEGTLSLFQKGGPRKVPEQKKVQDKESAPPIDWNAVDKAAQECLALAQEIASEMVKKKEEELDEAKIEKAVSAISKTLEAFTIQSEHAVVREARLEIEQSIGEVILGVMLDPEVVIERKIKLWKASETFGHAIHNAVVGHFELQRISINGKRQRKGVEKGDPVKEGILMEQEQAFTKQIVAMYGWNLKDIEKTQIHANEKKAADETKELTDYVTRNAMLARILAQGKTSAHETKMAEVHPNFWGLFVTPPHSKEEIDATRKNEGGFKTQSPSSQGAHFYNTPGHTRAMFMRVINAKQSPMTFATKGSGMDLTRPDDQYFSQFSPKVLEAKRQIEQNPNGPMSIFKHDPNAGLGHRTVGYGDWSMAKDDFHNFESKYKTAKGLKEPYGPLLKTLAQPMSVATVANTFTNRAKLPQSVLDQADVTLTDMPTQITTVAPAETSRRLHRATAEDQYRQSQTLQATGHWKRVKDEVKKKEENSLNEVALGGEQYEKEEKICEVIEYKNREDLLEGDESKGVKKEVVAKGTWQFRKWADRETFEPGEAFLYYYDLAPEIAEYKLATKEMVSGLKIPPKYLANLENKVQIAKGDTSESAIEDHKQRIQTGYALVYAVLGSLAVFTQEGDTSGFIGDSFEARNISTSVRDADEWGEGYVRFMVADDKVTKSGIMTLIAKELDDACTSMRLALRSAGVRRAYAPDLFNDVDTIAKAINVARKVAVGEAGKTKFGESNLPLLAYQERMAEAKLIQEQKPNKIDDTTEFWSAMSAQNISFKHTVALDQRLRANREKDFDLHQLMDPKKGDPNEQKIIKDLIKSTQDEFHAMMIVFFRDFVAKKIPDDLGEIKGLFAALFKAPVKPNADDKSDANFQQQMNSAKGQDAPQGNQGNANALVVNGLVTIDPHDKQNVITPSDALLEAYRGDIAYSTAYLSESEGNTLANAWHVKAQVYHQTAAPQGCTTYIDTLGKSFKERTKTLGGGDCLIHGLSIIKNGRNALPDEIRAARKTISESIEVNDLRMQALDLVNGYIEDRAEGVGPLVGNLLANDLSVQAARQRKLQEPPPKDASAKPKSSPESSASSSVSPNVLQNGNAAPGRIVLAATFGENQQGPHGFLLFVNENHFIALNPYEEEQAPNIINDVNVDDGSKKGSQVANSVIVSDKEDQALSNSADEKSKNTSKKKVRFADDVIAEQANKSAAKSTVKSYAPRMHGRSITVSSLNLSYTRRSLRNIVKALMPSDIQDANSRREFIERWVGEAELEDEALITACEKEYFLGPSKDKLVASLRKKMRVVSGP